LLIEWVDGKVVEGTWTVLSLTHLIGIVIILVTFLKSLSCM